MFCFCTCVSASSPCPRLFVIKKAGGFFFGFRPDFREALFAVDGFACGGLEWNHGGFSAVAASGFKHLFLRQTIHLD